MGGEARFPTFTLRSVANRRALSSASTPRNSHRSAGSRLSSIAGRCVVPRAAPGQCRGVTDRSVRPSARASRGDPHPARGSRVGPKSSRASASPLQLPVHVGLEGDHHPCGVEAESPASSGPMRASHASKASRMAADRRDGAVGRGERGGTRRLAPRAPGRSASPLMPDSVTMRAPSGTPDSTFRA